MRGLWRSLVVLCSLSLVSCGAEEGEAPPVEEPSAGAQRWSPLIDGGGWRPVEPSLDPFYARAEGRRPCGALAYGEEYGGVEVSTQGCGYLTLTQPLLRAVERGDLITLSAWHGPLVSAAPAEGLIALSLAEGRLWSRALSIPSEATSWSETFESPVAAQEGEALLFHVSNHGANSYTLYRLTVSHP